MTKIKSFFKQCQNTKVSVATGALALFALSLAILDYTPSMEVEGASTLQANVFAILDTVTE